MECAELVSATAHLAAQPADDQKPRDYEQQVYPYKAAVQERSLRMIDDNGRNRETAQAIEMKKVCTLPGDVGVLNCSYRIHQNRTFRYGARKWIGCQMPEWRRVSSHQLLGGMPRCEVILRQRSRKVPWL